MKNDFTQLVLSHGMMMVSWWKALDFHAVNQVRIYHADLHNFPCVQIALQT